MRISDWSSDVCSSDLTTLLFLVIFTVALGREGRAVLGVPFASFVAPGLIAMAMMQNSFANSSFSLLSGKIQGTIIDLLMPPLSEGEIGRAHVCTAVTNEHLVFRLQLDKKKKKPQ